MRRHVLSRLDDLDLDARELASAAARRAGLSLEEWAALIAAQDERPVSPPHPSRRKAGSDLDSLITRMSPASRARSKRDYDTLMAAIAAEREREAEQEASRTAVALESMASWIEQAESRLDEAARASSDQQDRIAALLSQALSVLQERLDAVERQVAAQPAAPPRIEFPMEQALQALAPVSENLAGLRADMARLATRLEQPDQALAPAVEAIRAEIDGLRSGMDHLATRTEIAALGSSLGSLAKDLEQGGTARDLRTLAGSITVLYEQVQALSEGVNHGLHERIGREIESLKGRIDRIAESGVDRSVIDFLSSQIVDLRQDLASRAEPQQMARLSESIEALGRQVAEIRRHQVSGGDLAALKRSLDDVCSALYVTATAQETSRIPEQLDSLSRRLDLLARRPDPEPVRLEPISEQLALLTERIAALSGARSEGGDALADLVSRLSSQMEAAAEREASAQEPLIQRFDRLEQELRQLGERSDTAGMAQMMRSLSEKLDRPGQQAGLDALERQIASLTERLGQMLGEPLRKVLDDAMSHLAQMQAEAAGIAERAARAALADIRPSLPEAGDLDALKHGFVELKALHSRSDKKTQETLRTVRDALETLTARLAGAGAPSVGIPRVEIPSGAMPPLQANRPLPADRLEAAVRRLHAATLSQMEEPGPGGPDTPLDTLPPKPPEKPAARPSDTTPAFADVSHAHLRASLIAAARRAAQGAAPEPAEPSAPPPEDGETGRPAEALPQDQAEPEAAPSLFERLRRTFEDNRRPLLLGLALLILATGATRLLPGEHEMPSLALATARELPEAASAAKPADAPGASASEKVSVFQTTSLSQSPSAPLAAGAFLADPSTAGGLPVEVPAALRQAALSGDAAALHEVAVRLAEGPAQDMTLAARFFERSAQAGFPPAQERLAALHEKGTGVTRDLRQAAFWYERAALGGHVRAMHNLATLLATGTSGKPDYPAALRWYAEAAEAGFRDSQFNAGILLARGIGSKPDLVKAFQWFSLAAAQGDAEAGRKRDELAGRLGAAELKAAKAALDQWRPRAVDPVANGLSAAPAQGQTAALDRTQGGRS